MHDVILKVFWYVVAILIYGVELFSILSRVCRNANGKDLTDHGLLFLTYEIKIKPF